MADVGSAAPDFTLTGAVNQEDTEVSLSDYSGKNLVVLFYPLAFSPVCAEQVPDFNESLAAIKGGSTALEKLDLVELGRLSFAAPDWENFPCLELCYRAGRAGGVVPAALNAANEVAVDAFLSGRIGFLDIAAVNEQMVEACDPVPADSLEAVLEADRWARSLAGELTSQAAVSN